MSGFEADTIILLSNNTIPIQSVRSGDRVLTSQGCRRVIMAGVTDFEEEVWEVTLTDGRTLHCTQDQPIFLRDKGEWVQVKDLEPGSRVTTIKKSEDVRIQGVAPLGQQLPVFSITLDRMKEYYANGVLVKT